MIQDAPLDEVKGPFTFVTSLAETHFFPFGGVLLHPVLIEEVNLDGLVEKLPVLANGVAEFDGLSLLPFSRTIFELEQGHRTEVDEHLGGEAHELRDTAQVLDYGVSVSIPLRN
jgi:hypothetical protein